MKKHWLYLAFLILIPVVFFKAFSAQYVTWDDDALIVNNPVLKAPFWEAFKSAFTVYYHGDYFPVTLLSYWVDMQVFGANAALQHTENVVLHLVAALLLLHCLLRLTKDNEISFLVTVIFAIHPLQMESVMWISERKSLLSAIFTFLSLYFYLETYEKPEKKRDYVLAAMFFVISGLTKASGLLMPFLFLILDAVHQRRNYLWMLKRFAPLAILSVVLIFIRILAYAASIENADEAIFGWQRMSAVPVMSFNALGYYITQFVGTAAYSPVYPDFEISTMTLLVSSVAALAMLKVTAYVWRSKEMFLWFSWGWFLLFLVPVLQIFPRINYVNDRYMYLPIIGLAGFCLFFLKQSIPKHHLKPKYFYVVAGVLALYLGSKTAVRSEALTSNRALWTQAIRVVPTSMLALNNLGLDYQTAGDSFKAVELYQKVIQQESQNSLKAYAYNNLANIYSDKQYGGYDAEKSIELLEQGIKSTHRLRDTYELRTNLGLTYKQVGRNAEARAVLTGVLADLAKESDYKFQWIKPIIEKSLQALPKE